MSTAYWELPGLEQVYLEESWVLGIEVDQQLAAFQLELVLTEDHPRYQPPRPGEQYCYAPARLVFECAELVELQLSGAPPATDASVNSDGRVPTGSCGSGAATAGLVELTAVTLGGAARTWIAGTEDCEGIAGRRRRAAVDQAHSGQLGADAAAGQPGHLDDPLPTPEPSPDRVADVDRRGGLGPHPVDLHVPGPAGLRGQGPCLHQPHRPQPAVDPRAVHAPMVTRGAARCPTNGLVGRPSQGA